MKPNNSHARYCQPIQIQMMAMSKMYSIVLTQISDNPLFRVLPNGITSSFKILSSQVLNKLSTILSPLLSACGGGAR